MNGASARGAVAFAVGSVRALVRADRRALAALQVRVRVEPARERYGLYVDRCAFGPDLYRDGRAAVLEDARGKSRSGQQQLELSWEPARACLAPDTTPEDLEAVDRMVRGETALPCETDR